VFGDYRDRFGGVVLNAAHKKFKHFFSEKGLERFGKPWIALMEKNAMNEDGFFGRMKYGYPPPVGQTFD